MCCGPLIWLALHFIIEDLKISQSQFMLFLWSLNPNPPFSQLLSCFCFYFLSFFVFVSFFLQIFAVKCLHIFILTCRVSYFYSACAIAAPKVRSLYKTLSIWTAKHLVKTTEHVSETLCSLSPSRKPTSFRQQNVLAKQTFYLNVIPLK